MRVIRRWAFVVGLGLATLLGCAVGRGEEEAPSSAPSASPSTRAASPSPAGGRVDGPTARRLVAEGALLVDVRTPQEFALGHIDGAVNVPVDQVARRAGELEPTTRPVVLYCRSGNRSSHAARVLRARGFTVHDLGAMTAW